MVIVVRVAIVGGSGYAGSELVRWVLAHPQLALTHVTSGAEAGLRVCDLYPALAGHCDLRFKAPDVSAIARDADVAILAVPHTAALEMVPGLLDRGLTVIDLSADFRLTDPTVYEAWYGVPHTAPGLLTEAVYGLPELDRSGLAGARLVAVAGCYPTASVLAALPALKAGIASGTQVVVDAKSGVSGAGRAATPASHYCKVNESVAPYKVGTHRHTPEIEQGFNRAAAEECAVLFVPHLVPMTRGLLSTVYLTAAAGLTFAEAQRTYEQHFADEPFVTVQPAGMQASTADVRGTNRASVSVTFDDHTGTLVAICAIDNLGKGAASQAIQCLNIVLGYPEATGLDCIGPVV